jgi:hypothetical protein
VAGFSTSQSAHYQQQPPTSYFTLPQHTNSNNNTNNNHNHHHHQENVQSYSNQCFVLSSSQYQQYAYAFANSHKYSPSYVIHYEPSSPSQPSSTHTSASLSSNGDDHQPQPRLNQQPLTISTTTLTEYHKQQHFKHKLQSPTPPALVDHRNGSTLSKEIDVVLSSTEPAIRQGTDNSEI